MIFEVPLSMVAWISVVVIQAIVHFGIIGRRLRKRESEVTLPPMERSESSTQLDQEQDIPENFDKLLSQTGDEVIKEIYHSSLRKTRIVSEQVARTK
mmetsp:Transcript_13864/g.21129  ORF Transcript_13864/g.21129 Transcript_13864/m.21129 type:complete len:97 (-) Transcript_13864:238-528(-)